MRWLTLIALAATIVGCRHQPFAQASAPEVRHGAAVIAGTGCGACHIVPGVQGARGRVGPSLAHIATQSVLIGTLPNTPANLLAWITAPQSVRPGDVMPDMELNDHDARDVVAYLYTLR
jgi:cytochrome c